MRRLQERRPVAALKAAEPTSASTGRPLARRRLLLPIVTAAVVVAADQLTKSLVLSDLHHRVHVIGPFGLGLSYNTGAAFSLFTGATGVIVVVALAVVALLVAVSWRTTTATMSVALGLVLGGALGNLADRLLRGHHGAVVDFITLSHFPTFNVADICITVGAVLVVLVTLLRPATKER